MPKTVSEWIKTARTLWPRNCKEKQIFGDGRYAVLTCAFLHPGPRQMVYSEVHLFQTKNKALKCKEDFHAKAKGLCRGEHVLVDLMTLKEES
jgi:hypothetical protein